MLFNSDQHRIIKINLNLKSASFSVIVEMHFFSALICRLHGGTLHGFLTCLVLGPAVGR